MQKGKIGFSGIFGKKPADPADQKHIYSSHFIDEIRTNGFKLKKGRLEIYLAQEFGFCYGVERAVEYAYETRMRFPDRRIFLTDELIHNPLVNQELRAMGVQFLSGPSATGVKTDDIGKNDVVIMPAFGVPVDLLKKFQERGCVIVDTTCGSVMSVWKRVESYARDGFTAVIHGKYDHEETKSTCSRAGKYLVVKDKKQAKLVCEFMKGNGTRQSFLDAFRSACSADFDPDKDLEKIGFANQTTMLSRESIEIADMFREALCSRYGESGIKERFRHFDTICSATQDRQDAVKSLGEIGVNLVLVIGGYKSSNTGHLAEIASGFAPTYHVEDAACLVSAVTILHKKTGTQDIIESKNWLPSGELRVGITAGASTPNRIIEEVIRRLIELAG